MDIENILKLYAERPAPAVESRKPKDILLIGFGGTISSGYSPQLESIRPLSPSPAIKQVEYLKLFGIHEIDYTRIDLAAKDSRKLTHEDIFALLDCIRAAPEKLVLITTGTYMLPKIAELVLRSLGDLDKVVLLTGSIVPAGFMASDADANIWSALTMGFYLSKQPLSQLEVKLVFHGKVFETLEDFRACDLHPVKTQQLVIQYPLSVVPADYYDLHKLDE